MASYIKNLAKMVMPPLLKPGAEKMIFDFADPNALSQFVTISDAIYGGFSEVSLTQIDGAVRFTGTTSTKLGPKMARSGFCAIRSKPLPNQLYFFEQNFNLEEYDQLEFKLRGDGRSYFINLKTDGFIPDDLYQSFFKAEKSTDFALYQMPFSDFLLTYRGLVQHDQPLIAKSRIKTFGIMISDRQDGEFTLDIAWIKAKYSGRI